MYYKDDFYKEFRTEKELCEYLEEIDSRAEWIRITSKKLKVAAAGEETCTEVPGISLEALEKDTLSHSRLVLILPERICYIGNSAIKSLKGRARIDGKALADVDKKTLAEILNKCLKVARGRALIRFCEGKIRAVLSGDEKDYAIISMPDMYMVTSAYEIYCGICESITIARQEKTNERGLLALEEKIAGCVSKRWHEYDIPGTVKY